jgi:hypothetical protein
MNAISHRSTKVCGSLVALAAAALTACATTGGTVANGAATSHAARPLAAATTATPLGYVVCSGGRASRFPEQEKIGRVCRPAVSLEAIY